MVLAAGPEVMAYISIYCGFCLWSAGFALSAARAFSLTSFEAYSFLLRLNKGRTFLPSGSE